MKNRILTVLSLVSSFSISIGEADIVRDTHAVLDQWVETQHIISETKNNWDLEKSILLDSESFLANESARLDAVLKSLDETATAADQERIEMTDEKETLQAAFAVVEGKIAELETKVRAAIETFPEPLIERIQPLIRRLPADSSATKLTIGERVQNIVGILSQADKFNGTITHTSESREIGDGRIIEVRTLYWGLGGAYFVDAEGDYAGVGYIEENEWKWSPVEGSGPRIKRLLEVYEGIGKIQFVEVSARID